MSPVRPPCSTELALIEPDNVRALTGPTMRLHASLGRRPRNLAYSGDPYGAALLRAAMAAKVPAPRPSSEAEFTAAVRDRHYDEVLSRAVGKGIAHVVHVGAGLDTKAFRLPLPGNATVYEIDVPAVVAFKEQVLSETGAIPMLRRVVIPASPGDDWQSKLRAGGYDPRQPSVWILESLNICDGSGDPSHVTQQLWGIVAPGSLICGEAPRTDGDPARIARRLVPAAADAEVTSRADLATRLHRSIPDDGDGWFVTITR